MMIGSPLTTTKVFSLGPVAITTPVVVTWGLMIVIGGASFFTTRSLALRPSAWQAGVELFIGAMEQQIRETIRVSPQPYLPFLGTLFIFILVANWSSLIPGVEPPTAHLETDAALALLVFCAVFYFGIRARGLLGFLKTFAEPSVVMIPLNIVETFTRIFSLLVRLFGNIMSGVFIIAIVLSLAGLIVPIPLMALDILTGAVQAYIFTVLAMVFIGGVVSEDESTRPNQLTKAETNQA